MKSRIIRGVSKNARFFVINSTDVVQKALEIHKCSPTAIAGFGRFLTAGLIMGASLKGDDKLSLITDTDGPVNNMVVTADANGHIKGYLSNPQADLPLKPIVNQPDVANLIGKGSLRVIKDMGLKEPYCGLSEIQTGEIATDIAYYYVTSEQTPTVIALGVDLQDEKTVRSAGGYMVQLFPGADEKFIDLLEAKIKAIRNVTELFKGGMDLERIVKLLYEDMSDETYQKLVEDYEILEEREVSYYCDCNKEKYYKGLITLGKEEILNLLEELDGTIETECHFCGKKYQFTKEDFKEFLESK
ncbi:Hsp33 family molecular chaperone HslO [Fusobacterium perfoetens]|uniref:Hsp33 family molecular chaperone HslO n=1 Tax=Fusobacterium perfoetens TaxID=852 RepID=UPI001F1FD2FA|nr:Hsp33 family molecular chaperone HslO [Fusobacterium perfoetens]MCF2612174.1 Hsp33 family molecular chaperone HslO [Fusobacterium perfoetens]